MNKSQLIRNIVLLPLLIVIVCIPGHIALNAQNKNYQQHPQYNEFMQYYQAYEQAAASRNFVQAMGPLKQAMELGVNIFGEGSPTVGLLYDRLGYTHYATGNFDHAIELFNKAVTIYTGIYGSDSTYNASVYINIGETYRSKGDINRALEYLSSALTIYTKTHGAEHEYVATTYNYIGGAYKSKGNYDKAIENYQKALKIYIHTLGEDHQFVATTYVNLGGSHEPKGEYDKAVEYYLKAIPIYQKSLGEDHPFLAVAFNNLGLGYYYLNDGTQSIEYYEKALAIYKKNLGENHPYIAYTYINLGLAARSALETDKALAYYSMARESLEKSSDRDGHIQVLGHMAELFRGKGDMQNTEKIHKDAIAMLLKYRLEIGRGKTGFMERYGYIFDDLIDIQLTAGNIRDAFKTDSLKKGLSIAEDMSLKDALVYGGVPEDKAAQLIDLANEIEELASRRTVSLDNGNIAEADSIIKKIWALETKKEAYDAELIRGYPDYKTLRSTEPPAIEDLQHALKADEALISYSLDTKNCVAFIVTKKHGLKMVNLKETDESAYDSIINHTRNLHTLYKSPLGKNPVTKIETSKGNIIFWNNKQDEDKYEIKNNTAYERTSIESNYTPKTGRISWQFSLKETGTLIGEIDSTEIKAMRNILSQKLFTLILKPALEETGPVKNLILIPDGPLYYCPWGILANSQDKYFTSTHRHRLVHSSAVWLKLRKRKPVQAKYPLLALGNAIYSKDHHTHAKAQRGKTRSAGKTARSLLIQGKEPNKTTAPPFQQPYYNNLPGTDEEVHAIINLTYGKNSKSSNHILTGIAANEDRIFAMNQNGALSQYGIIHFAAHGLFIENYPSLNAIILTLPDTARDHKRSIYSDYASHYGELKRDGYLRMGEIKTLNLKCRLVVMSACETSLGNVVQGEGMIGLPQAFLMAGSQSVLASLWPVDDEATFILMEEFYTNMLKKKLGPHEALQKAQSALQEEYNDPYYWAPFIIYGE